MCGGRAAAGAASQTARPRLHVHPPARVAPAAAVVTASVDSIESSSCNSVGGHAAVGHNDDAAPRDVVAGCGPEHLSWEQIIGIIISNTIIAINIIIIMIIIIINARG